MPWTPADAKRHKRGLSPRQARQWAHIANSVLERCLRNGGSQSYCEGAAVRQANGAVGRPARASNEHGHPLLIQTALTVAPQRMTVNQQEYLTAPVVLVVEGVLNGGLIPGEALHPDIWNGMPVTVGHPMDAVGVACSARQPEVLARCGLGQVFRVRRSTGLRQGQQVVSLAGELWLHLGQAAACGEQGQACIARLEAQEPLEVSTAFYSEASQSRGVFLGAPYTEVHHQLRADHLALLPQSIGACSWQDGCGAPRLHQESLTYTCACGGTCDACAHEEEEPMPAGIATQWRHFVQVLKEFVQGAEQEEPAETPPVEPLTVEDSPPWRELEVLEALRRRTAGEELTVHEQSILLAPEVYAIQTTPHLQLGQTDVDVRDALYGCLSREMGTDVTPIYIQDIDTGASTFRYRCGERLCQRSWRVEEGVIALNDDATDVQRSTTYAVVPDSPSGPQGMPGPETYQEEPMPATDVIKRRVNALIANPRTRWSEDDRHLLEGQPEAFLIRLEQQPQEVEAPPPPQEHEPETLEEAISTMPRHLQETMAAAAGAYLHRKATVIDIIVNNKQNPFSREELELMPVERLEKLVVMSGEPLPGQPSEQLRSNFNGKRIPHLRIVTQEGENDDRPPPLPDTTALVVEEQKRRGVRF